MPNILAYVVLFSWPLVTWFLFRRLKLTEAITATVLLGYLFIPERVSIKLSGVPALDKAFMPSLCALIAVILYRKAEKSMQMRLARRDPNGADTGRRVQAAVTVKDSSSRFVILVMAILVFAPVLTWFTNQQPIFIGGLVLPGVRPYDIGSMGLSIIVLLLPFLLARRELGSREAQMGIFKIFTYCALVYTIPIVWEARMSPQLNVNLYGFFAHDWIQHVRGGYFRPIVFLEHGLRVGIFLTLGMIACATLARANADGRRGLWLIALVYMSFCMVISRNTGALGIALVLIPFILIASVRIQLILACIIALVVLLYPIARGSEIIPTQKILDAAYSFNPDRGQSLEFRLTNEDNLLQRANEKPLAGWGPWGRSRIYDSETGKDTSVTDGSWIIIIGMYGWIGYIGQFGLLTLPLVVMLLRQRRFGFDPLDAGLAMMVAANLIDLVPNSSNVSILWLLAGSLWARIDYCAGDAARKRQAGIVAPSQQRRIMRQN